MIRRIILTLLTLMLAVCIGLSLLAIIIMIVLLTTPGSHYFLTLIT